MDTPDATRVTVTLTHPDATALLGVLVPLLTTGTTRVESTEDRSAVLATVAQLRRQLGR